MTSTQILINQIRRNHKALRTNEAKTNKTSRPTYRANTINYYRTQVERGIASLIEADAEIAGRITEELLLVDRIAESKKAGFNRPELKKRLKTIRSATA
jgi:hypothetical protein